MDIRRPLDATGRLQPDARGQTPGESSSNVIISQHGARADAGDPARGGAVSTAAAQSMPAEAGKFRESISIR